MENGSNQVLFVAKTALWVQGFGAAHVRATADYSSSEASSSLR
jgi:hypothetical protein